MAARACAHSKYVRTYVRTYARTPTIPSPSPLNAGQSGGSGRDHFEKEQQHQREGKMVDWNVSSLYRSTLPRFWGRTRSRQLVKCRRRLPLCSGSSRARARRVCNDNAKWSHCVRALLFCSIFRRRLFRFCRPLLPFHPYFVGSSTHCLRSDAGELFVGRFVANSSLRSTPV